MNKTNGTTAIKNMQVLKSTEYSKFKILPGNRNINTLHFNRLRDSMAEDFLFSPIIVNEKFEVIDGQHRLKCCEELKLPVYYLTCQGYGLSEIQRYNVNTKNWSMDDFMNGYIELGKKEYEFYKLFKDKYGFGHRESLRMLVNQSDHIRMNKDFMEGKLRIKNYNNACILAEKIKMVEPFYDGWRRRSFVMALVSLINKGNFNIEEFVDKLRYQQSKMYDCGTSEQYIQLIEEIYNFKRREKISLRFAA